MPKGRKRIVYVKTIRLKCGGCVDLVLEGATVFSISPQERELIHRLLEITEQFAAKEPKA